MWCEILSSQWLASWKCPPPWADYPLLLYRPPGITFDVWGQNKKPRSYYASGAFSSFFLSILRIVYFYMGEEG